MATASARELEGRGRAQKKTKQKIVLEETKRAARGSDRAGRQAGRRRRRRRKNMPHKLRPSSRDSLTAVGAYH